MRLLLILALVLTSLAMGMPAHAEADAAATCHSMAQDEHHGERGKNEAPGGAMAIHSCPGCALVDPAVPTGSSMEAVNLPEAPLAVALLDPFQSNPIPPPPRMG